MVAAAVSVLATLLKIVLMLVATPGMIAPAATATKPAIKAYSMRSWPRVSFQILSFHTKLLIRVMYFSFPPTAFSPPLLVSYHLKTVRLNQRKPLERF